MASTNTKTLPLKTPSSLKNSMLLPSLVGIFLGPRSGERRDPSRFNKEFAKIKKMATVSANTIYFFLLITVLVPGLSRAECGDETSAKEEKRMVERINDRYDDFFKRQHEIEAKQEMREKDSGDIKKFRAQQKETNEQARQEFVKNRKPRVVDPKLEEHWLEQDKAWKEQNKVARNCYVRSKEAVKNVEKKGRRIPEMKEYGLDE